MVITLTPIDLAVAALLVIALAAVSWRMKLGVSSQLLVAGIRTIIQLLLVGLVLKVLFANADLGWVLIMAVVMLRSEEHTSELQSH